MIVFTEVYCVCYMSTQLSYASTNITHTGVCVICICDSVYTVYNDNICVHSVSDNFESVSDKRNRGVERIH